VSGLFFFWAVFPVDEKKNGKRHKGGARWQCREKRKKKIALIQDDECALEARQLT
jgi:hypothetical protein